MNARLWLVALMTFVGACATSADDADDLSELGDDLAAEAKADGNTTLVGTVRLGFGRRVLYKRTPRYRAVKFHAEAGTMLEVYVRSTQGDPITWLTDANLQILAMSDDANEETNSNISIESLAATGDYYVVFRDKHLESHYFDVAPLQLNRPANAPSVQAIETVYEGLLATNQLATAQIGVTGLPYMAKTLYERWVAEKATTPNLVVGAYNLRVTGQSVWFIRKYLPGQWLEAGAYAETGPMIGIAGGTTEQIDTWEH